MRRRGNAPGCAYATSQSVASSLESWRALRQSSGYRFSDYAHFLITNPDWPDTTRMRGWAEKAMQPGENARTVLAFFATEKPKTGNGWARLAEAYAATGQPTQALDAARHAWASADLGATDEQSSGPLCASFTRADHDARVDALLFAKKAGRCGPLPVSDEPGASGGLRSAHRNAAECGGCGKPLSGGDRQMSLAMRGS